MNLQPNYNKHKGVFSISHRSDKLLNITGNIPNESWINNNETNQYFYHGDHLGSSSWITDASGNVNQHLQYMPFGEQFIDQRATSHDIRFKFTGKERDAETGYSYFGARYYASDLSVWLSVDMLDFKYQSMSPYIYTAGNPVMFIDADGNDWFKGKNGEIKYFKDVTGDFSDVETKQEWKHIGVMGMGLNEKNGKIIFYKSDGTQRETSRSLEGVDIHPTYASNTNNPSKSTNNKNGYIWNERDLKMWEYLKNGDDPISRYVQSQISQGYYPILSEQNFYDIYGYKTGRLMVFKLYLDMALEIGTDAPRGGKSISLRSKTIIKSPNKVKPPSFQKYLKMTTGKYKGGARGDNLRRGWSDYKWRYCN